jgi:hypothetical protein
MNPGSRNWDKEACLLERVVFRKYWPEMSKYFLSRKLMLMNSK